VTVAVPARLHLGFLDPSGALGRRFGSIGLAIESLGTRLTISRATVARIDGPDHERAARHLAAMCRRIGVTDAHELSIDEVVPAHAGLGSGTQLALAVAAGLRQLHCLPLDIVGDALALGRGARSGVGIGLFESGGLVVDGGHGPTTAVAPIVSRMAFPEAWRVLVVLDPARRGASGDDERNAFAALADFPAPEAAQLCALVLMRALPALAEGDCAAFGLAISELQARLGDYFAPVQGGRRFISPQVEALLANLAAAGAVGIGQSSWGPTGFAFAPSQAIAARLVELGRKHPAGRGLDIRACKALNRGADIKIDAGTD
jgi:beta-RFAP synthase